jgi:hypothetical protein
VYHVPVHDAIGAICRMTKRRSVRVAIVAAVVVAGVSLVHAQQIWVGGRSGRFGPRYAEAEDFNGQYMYCRGAWTNSNRGFRGGGWTTDYPGADNNFSIRLAELTRVDVKFDENRQPHHVVIPLTDPLLYKCPMLFMENVETLRFSESEVAALRTYLLKGGFIWVDDFWGSAAWANWEREISRVLPPAEFPMFDVPLSHPIMHSVYEVKQLLQVSAISFWYRSGGSVSERGRDSDEVHYRGIQDSHGRLMVLATHNTDVADTWEREGESQEYFDLFSPRGYAIGVNVVIYAMTH